MRLEKLKLRFLAVVTALVVSSCERPPEIFDSGLPDTKWLTENLVTSTAQPRLTHGLRENGYFQPFLDRHWQPIPLEEQKANLVTQSRFVYVMATAYEVSGDEAYLSGLRKAADYLLTDFAKPEKPGHWIRGIHPDGAPENLRFHAYGQAQLIFALAHAYHVTNDVRYHDAAMQSWIAMDVPSAVKGLHSDYELRGLNTVMHLYESLLVLHKATHSAIIKDDLVLLGNYIVDVFFDSERGVFIEGVDEELKPRQGGSIRLGHAAEMAFLLSRGVAVGLPSQHLLAAERSLDFVVRVLKTRDDRLIPHSTNYDGEPEDLEYYWWSQTELLRSMAHFAWQRDRSDLKVLFDEMFSSTQAHFIDPENGGWYRKKDEHTEDKGQRWKSGYHVSMLLTELLRLQRYQFTTGFETLL